MSALGSIERTLTDPWLAVGVQYAEPLTRTRTGAGAVRAGIRYEALLRRQQRRYLDVVSAMTGATTAQQRRRRAELAARRELTPSRQLRGRGVPAVHWHGPDEVSGDRPVVALVNGWTASGLVWPRELVERLDEDHDVVRIDNRGTGYSRTAPAPFTIARMADDVAAVLCAIGARRATLVGLSMGGMIAQETALRHPRLVERLVLCGTRPPAPAGFFPARSMVNGMIGAPEAGEDVREFVARQWTSVTGPGFALERPDLTEELVDVVLARITPRAGVIGQLRAIASWHGAGRLSRITAPTTVIHGTDDPLIPVGNGMRLAQLIPAAEYIELSGVGHVVPFEAPDVVAEAIGSGDRVHG